MESGDEYIRGSTESLVVVGLFYVSWDKEKMDEEPILGIVLETNQGVTLKETTSCVKLKIV